MLLFSQSCENNTLPVKRLLISIFILDLPYFLEFNFLASGTIPVRGVDFLAVLFPASIGLLDFQADATLGL
jgi:hypothetical protein